MQFSDYLSVHVPLTFRSILPRAPDENTDAGSLIVPLSSSLALPCFAVLHGNLTSTIRYPAGNKNRYTSSRDRV